MSEKTINVIRDLLEKYNLKTIQEKGLKELDKATTFKEKEKALENLPARKIAKIAKEASEGKIAVEDLGVELKKRLGISATDALNFAKELRERVISSARKVTIEEEDKETSPKPLGKVVKPPPEMPEGKIAKAKSKIRPKEELGKIEASLEKTIPKRQDIYRELVEDE